MSILDYNGPPISSADTTGVLRQPADEVRAIRRAQLADMPLQTILDYLRERRHGNARTYLPYCPCESCSRVRSPFPPGYPPLADDDLPFVEDGRG